MDLFAKILMGWGILSVPSALFVGAMIRAGQGALDPVDRAQADYDQACERGDKRAMSSTFRALYDAKHAQLADEVWGRK